MRHRRHLLPLRGISQRRRLDRGLSGAGPRRGLPADAADAAGHPEPRPARGRHDDLQSRPTATDRHPQGPGHRHRGVPAEPSREGRKPDAGVRGPGGHRPRPLRHLRRGRPQLRPALRAAPHQEAQVVQLRLQRPTGQLRRTAQGSCWATTTTILPARPTPRSSCTRSAGRCRPSVACRWSRSCRRCARSSTAPTASCFSTRWAT